jgi:hypothetical protein
MRDVRAASGSCSLFCVLFAVVVAACSSAGSRSAASTTNVPTSLATEHVVSLSLATASELAWRRAAAERCKADPTITAVRVTPVAVTPTTSDPNAFPALRVVQYRCRELLAAHP